ncbi:hemolysin III family protein [Haloimpatiens sp. FM7315]|uniref:PAQR family membrane homeostasis protein TrhA n=1 Tax=Haloimpatiens sp. FM7315 TaxID=3298609 RepID=UPI0035A32BB4
MVNKYYTKGEEIANAIIHGVGALGAIAALVILIVYSCIYGNAWHIVSFTIFGSNLILLYIFSTLYHSIQAKKAKKVMRVFDHSSIFLLIAGTYTPFTLTVLRGPLGWTIFGIEWGLAILGIVFKAIVLSKHEELEDGKLGKISTLIYIIMGWFIVISLKKLYVSISTISLVMLVAGGVTYTLGSYFYSKKNMPYAHSIWHVFVLTASVFHFFAVLFLLPIK